MLTDSIRIKYAPGPLQDEGASRGATCFHCISLSPREREGVRANSACAVTGAHVSLTACVVATFVTTSISPCESNFPFDCRNKHGTQGKGEVDFAAYPTISH